MYWRVLRINGDGSIRLIYAGNISPKENESVNSLERSNSIFNTYGYLENFEESEANMVDLYKSKRVYYLLNKWYSYMFGDNNEYLTLANFCYGDEKSSTKPQDNNFSTSPDFDYYYASYDRLTTYKPSLKCNSGLSESNVGLISMDEAMFAGLNDKDNFGNYLNNFDNVCVFPIKTTLIFSFKISRYNFLDKIIYIKCINI